MKKYQQSLKKNAGLVGTIVGGVLIGLPAIPLAASAQPLSTLDKVNPCPGIYYEEPFNTTRMVPQGCRPNAATRGVSTRTMVPDRAVLRDQEAFTEPLTPAPPAPFIEQPPLPEERSEPVALVMPTNGTVDVRLKNTTNAIVKYQAVQFTPQRALLPGEEVLLQNVPTPVTITAYREDDGLLKMAPISSSEPGLLEVSLQEENTLDDNQGVLRIQETGKVFLN